MQTRYTVDIVPSEWRWVTTIASALILLAFLPFLWVALSGSQEWQFMGTLHNYQDGGSYLSKMVQGMEGHWLLRFQHTPEDFDRVFIQVLYPVLGQIARVTSFDPIVLFHVARVGASLFMYLALYHLAASIWKIVRTRRIFFIIVSVGAGLGWFFGPALNVAGIADASDFPDLTVAEAFPFASTFANVHFPLTIACLALMASYTILFFRPGADRSREIDGNIAVIGLMSVTLSIIYPQALVPIGVALGIYMVVSWLQRRHGFIRMVRWMMAVVVPALPLAAYYIAIVTYNDAIALWNSQNVTPAPPFPVLLLGLGIPLFLAVPALIRTIRNFEQDDDRFMLIWLLTIIILMYLPTNVQRRFATGIMIPVAYFATRSIADFWFNYIRRRWRGYFFAILIPIIMVSQLFVLFIPVLPVVAGNPQQATGVFLQQNYRTMFALVALISQSEDVVLASPIVSVWVPGWTGARVIYGHEFETLEARDKRVAVTDWYRAESASDCRELLETYKVDFVIVGPEEERLADGNVLCTQELNRMVSFGNVRLYAP